MKTGVPNETDLGLGIVNNKIYAKIDVPGKVCIQGIIKTQLA